MTRKIRPPVLPDPQPGELYAHLADRHGTSLEAPYPSIAALAHAHLLAHIRGDFAGQMHVHEQKRKRP